MRLIALISVVALTATLSASAQRRAPGAIRIDSVQTADFRTPIAIPQFASASGQEALADEIARLVVSDLDFTGLFRIISSRDYPENFRGFSRDVSRMDFANWRKTPAEYLVYAYVYIEGRKVVAECRLFDVQASRQVLGTKVRGDSEKWYHLIAHQFADEIVLFLTGERGIATSEIFFSGGVSGRKEIYVADYDGRNVIQITRHGSISINPECSPDGNLVAYLSYKDRYPYLYIFDRNTGQSRPFSKKVGLNAAPSWSPDGKSLAIVLSKDGNTEIYLSDVEGGNLSRLTKNRFGDTSPTFSPDGSHIAFVSDRLGSAQIFSMDDRGGNVRRLSVQGGRSYDPEWSPDGRHIAYVVEKSGEGLEIYVMDTDGMNAKRLTESGGSNEAPSWSPDSRHIIFTSTRRGRPDLWTVSLDTGQVRRNRNIRIGAQGPVWGSRRL